MSQRKDTFKKPHTSPKRRQPDKSTAEQPEITATPAIIDQSLNVNGADMSSNKKKVKLVENEDGSPTTNLLDAMPDEANKSPEKQDKFRIRVGTLHQRFHYPAEMKVMRARLTNGLFPNEQPWNPPRHEDVKPNSEEVRYSFIFEKRK